MTSFQGQKRLDRELVFWTKVDKRGSYECWPYLSGIDEDGYGRFWTGITNVGAHCYVWSLTRKCEVPPDKMILHMCDNRSCCNPGHLYAGTQMDNMRDRYIRGPKVPAHILANPDLHNGEIWLIRRLKIVLRKGVKKTTYRFSQVLVSRMFKVHQTTIHHIWHSDRWLSKEGTYV